MLKSICTLSATFLFLSGLIGCATAPDTAGGRADLESRAATALSAAKSTDPSFSEVVGKASGVAVFPSIGKGAIGIGGAYGKGVVRAELDVKPDLWFFGCHFKGDPVMPGCLGLDALWQMTGFFLGWLGLPGRGRALGVGEVKLTDQVLPLAKRIIYGVDVKRIFKGRLNLAIADGWLETDGKRMYEVADMRVGVIPASAAGAA